MLDLRITGGTLVTAGKRLPLDLGIETGRVVGWFERGAAPEAARTIDATGLFVLPGAVDVHFHSYLEPDGLHEDIGSGTAAAAAGGVTTVVQMPVPDPQPLVHRIEAGRRLAYVDFALHGITGETEAEAQALAEGGVVGFKMFMTGAGDPLQVPGLRVGDDASLLRRLRTVAKTGKVATVHCELQGCIDLLSADLKAAGRNDGPAHVASRPSFVETAAVAKLLPIAESAGVQLHLAHVSSIDVVDQVVAARARGVQVSMETCPHYLYCDDAVMSAAGPYAKINPPIRPAGSAAPLWAALEDGRINIVASDHNAYLPEQKEPFWQDIWSAGPGHPGVETTTALILGAALEGRLSLERAVELLSTAPAERFGLGGRKNGLRPGGDADFILFDPNGQTTFDRRRMLSRGAHGARLFDGWTVRGRMTMVAVRGEPVSEDGRLTGKPGHGQFLPAAEPSTVLA